MSNASGERVNQMVDETAKAVQSAIQAGLELQHASARWMIGAWGEPQYVQTLQKQHQAMLDTAIQAGRKGVDSLLQAMNENTRVGLQWWQSVLTPASNGHGNGHSS